MDSKSKKIPVGWDDVVSISSVIPMDRNSAMASNEHFVGPRYNHYILMCSINIYFYIYTSTYLESITNYVILLSCRFVIFKTPIHNSSWSPNDVLSSCPEMANTENGSLIIHIKPNKDTTFGYKKSLFAVLNFYPLGY